LSAPLLAGAAFAATEPGESGAEAPTDSAATAASVLGPGHWRAVISPYMFHIHPSAEHKPVWALGVERQRDDGWLAGAVYFSNSFGQHSGYLYVGQQYVDLFGHPQLFFEWSAGLLYGYRGKYENKVPFNYNGYSPGALIGLGWSFTRQTSASVLLLGDAGFMLQLSYDFR
jgi:hypothetical protein